MNKFPDYQIKVTNPNSGDVVAFIPLVNSFGLKYDNERNTIGAFALTLPYSDFYWDAFSLDAIVDIMRSDYNGTFQTEASYFARYRERIESETDERLIVSGWHVNHLLKRRYIDPTDDSTQPNGGYATKAGEAASVIRAYIREQAGDLASSARVIDGLSVPSPTITSIGIGENLRYENLWEQMVKLANIANLDIQITHEGNRQFVVFIGRLGEDKSINSEDNLAPTYKYTILSPLMGNLSDVSYIEDFKETTTYVRIRGSGARENRTALEIPSPDISTTIYNRIERTSDARNTKEGDLQTLYIAGLRYLEQNRGKIEFEGKIISTTGGAIYRKNWVLGDVVTFQWGQIEKDLRIIKVQFEVGSADEQLSIEVSNADE